VEQTTCQQLYT